MLLTFTEIRAKYRAVAPFRLPDHCGSLLRGVLGRALRRAACVAPDPCASACQSPAACAYTRLFDPSVPDPLPHRFLRGATRAPQPLVPLFPTRGGRWLEAGHDLDLGVRILGPLQPGDAERLHAAFEHVADFPLGPDSGRVVLDTITQIGAHNRHIDVRPGEPAQGHVRMSFETPVWIEHGGRLIAPADVDFVAVFRQAYRRLTTLAALYGTPEADDELTFADLAALAGEVCTVERDLRALRWERWSVEKDVRHPMRGLVGSVVFEGPLGALLPALHAAEVVHVGKGTSHGLGAVRVEWQTRPGGTPPRTGTTGAGSVSDPRVRSQAYSGGHERLRARKPGAIQYPHPLSISMKAENRL